MNSNVLMQKLVFVASVASQAVLYVLLGLSVLSIGVIIERWWYFRRRRDDLDALSDRLRKAFGRGDVSGGAQAARRPASRSRRRSSARRSTGTTTGPEAVEQILAKATRAAAQDVRGGPAVPRHARQQRALHRPLRHGARHRDRVPRAGRQPMGAMGNVMSGIAEALIATAVGILVALPAVIFYNVFQKKGADIEEQAGRARQRRHRLDARRTADAAPMAARRAAADRTGEHVARAAGVEA